MAWLVSIQWFICSVCHHLGLLPSSEGSAGLESTVTHSHARQWMLPVDGSSVVLLESQSSKGLSLGCRLPTAWQLHPKGNLSKDLQAQTTDLSLCRRRYTTSLPPHFMEEVARSLWSSNPPWCVFHLYLYTYGFPGGSAVKKKKSCLPMQETQVQSLSHKYLLE